MTLCVKPELQPLSGEQFQYRAANVDHEDTTGCPRTGILEGDLSTRVHFSI